MEDRERAIKKAAGEEHKKAQRPAKRAGLIAAVQTLKWQHGAKIRHEVPFVELR